jgi:arylsulfatase A-like enzyme
MRTASGSTPLRLAAAGALAALALVLTLAVRPRPVPEETHAPPAGPWTNVILISIDTLRADRLGCYGYERPTSPVLDDLAANGARFARAISQAPWTTPSHMSLFTGLYPSEHGLNLGWAEFRSFRDGRGGYRRLQPEIPTLAERLRAHGYRTLARTGGGTVAGELGFARGFDEYLEPKRGPRSGRRLPRSKLRPELLADLVAWVESSRDAPFFLFFHTFEVHAPYLHAELARPLLDDAERAHLDRFFTEPLRGRPLEALREHLERGGLFRAEVTSAMYDSGIRHTDAFLGRLFAELRQLGLWERTLILVTSDHGEEFGEHDPERFYDAHCRTLYDELLHVPLILHAPGLVPPGVVIDEVVELVDVAPTMLELLGLPAPEGISGRSLAALLRGGTGDPNASALSEAVCSGPEQKSLRTARHKYVAAFDAPGGERSGIPGPRRWQRLFDLERDPGEQHDALRARPELVETLRARLGAALAPSSERGFARGTGPGPSEDLLRRLRELGYLD